MCHFQSQTVGKLLVYRVPSHTKPQWSGPWSTWSLTLISECNTLRLWRCCSPDTNWCKSPESLAPGIFWSTRDVLLAKQGKKNVLRHMFSIFIQKTWVKWWWFDLRFFFPPFQAILKHFWSDLLAHRPGAQTVHPRCSPSARHPRINHLVTIGDHFLPAQFLAYHPQKPWVCFSINLFMSAISAPFWGGPFMFFWHWGSWNEYDKNIQKHTQNAGITGLV